MLITIIFAVLCICLLALVERQSRRTERLVSLIAAEALQERKSLLDRIQHPQRVQVTPMDNFEHQLPKDSVQWAHIGGVVPDGVDFGPTVD